MFAGVTVHKSFVVFYRGYLRRLCMISAFKKYSFLGLLFGLFASMGAATFAFSQAEEAIIKAFFAEEMLLLLAAQQGAIEAKSLTEKINAEAGLAQVLLDVFYRAQASGASSLKGRQAAEMLIKKVLKPMRIKVDERKAEIEKEMGVPPAQLAEKERMKQIMQSELVHIQSLEATVMNAKTQAEFSLAEMRLEEELNELKSKVLLRAQLERTQAAAAAAQVILLAIENAKAKAVRRAINLLGEEEKPTDAFRRNLSRQISNSFDAMLAPGAIDGGSLNGLSIRKKSFF